MTLIMAWRESDLPRVWIVSDSRLSQAGALGRKRLTDCAAKLMSVELVLHRQTPRSVFGTPILSRRVAFAYSGSALIALQAYTAILPLWSHLQSSGPERLPSIAECAVHLAGFVEAYGREVSTAGGFQPCECALIGFDDELDDIDGWSVRLQVGDELHAELRRLDLTPGAIELFGSGANSARESLHALIPHPGGTWAREPLAMLRTDLREGTISEDVGGAVQLGSVSPEGFELYFDVQPVVRGSPLAVMRFRGFDFSEINQVGQAFVNMRGMS